jgi:hypothetical protein
MVAEVVYYSIVIEWYLQSPQHHNLVVEVAPIEQLKQAVISDVMQCFFTLIEHHSRYDESFKTNVLSAGIMHVILMQIMHVCWQII